MLVCVCTQLCPPLCNLMHCSPPGFLCLWDFPGKNIGVGCHFLLQGIDSTHGSNPCLLHWQADSFTTEPPKKPLWNFKTGIMYGANYIFLITTHGTPLQYSCLESPMDWRAWWAAVPGVAKSRTRLSNFTFTFYFHALEKETATHSSVLAWRIPGTGEPGGLLSMGLHRVGHDWSDLAAAAITTPITSKCFVLFTFGRFFTRLCDHSPPSSHIFHIQYPAFQGSNLSIVCVWDQYT